MRIVALLCCILPFAACSDADLSGLDRPSSDEPPFFVADENATGPLTLAELQIDLPDEIESELSDTQKVCFFEAVERRALEAGDPASLNPDDFEYWGGSVDRSGWKKHGAYMQRILLAQAIISWAMIDC